MYVSHLEIYVPHLPVNPFEELFGVKTKYLSSKLHVLF